MSLTERAMTIERQMSARAKQKVLNASSWFTHAELARLTGTSLTDLETQLHAWKETKMIFSVLHEGLELFPAYAFPNDKRQPLNGLQVILSLFAGKKDNWGVTYWFASANGYLAGKRPQDLLQSDPENVLQAAEDELVGVTHG